VLYQKEEKVRQLLVNVNIIHHNNKAEDCDSTIVLIGVTLVVGAMKIDGGTGGPVRLIAMFDEDKQTISSATITGYGIFMLITATLLSLA